MKRTCVLCLLLCVGGYLTVPTEGNAQEKPIKIKRRHELSDEDLRKQLKDPVPELGYQQNSAMFVYTPIDQAKKIPEAKRPVFAASFGLLRYDQLATSLNQREYWTALPWRTGQDSQMGKESAERLQVLSANLRRFMREAVAANDVRPNPDKLRAVLGGVKALEWDRPEAVPTLMQMLQTENTPIRSLLVETLGRIEGKEASVALAQRAIFDLSPEVREKAVQVLAARPRKEFQQVMVESLRFPWSPAADHAAEAIVALQLKDLQSELVQLLKEPDPKLPYMSEVGGIKSPMVREMVRVNHLCNCALCHALSTSKEDLVRGRVPMPGQEMPPLYYAETTGLFVRADITFLRQDFSVVQPVSNPVKWSGHQRYDYLVRTRKATPMEAQGLQGEKKLNDPYPQRDAVLFALRELTGRDLGSRTENWLPLLNPIRDRQK